jgi:hypothetical protein
MIRILVPFKFYNEKRIDLVTKKTPLKLNTFSNVKRAYNSLEKNEDLFLEGFVETLKEANWIGDKLTDTLCLLKQNFLDMETYCVDEYED